MCEQELLINYTPQETRVAIVEDGKAQELHLQRAAERSYVGNIYLGKVSRILPGMQSAFVDIGLDRTAFLYVADVWNAERYQLLENNYAKPQRQDGDKNLVYGKPIEKQLFEGQTLLVQVLKDPIAAKGARLTTQLSIAGRYLVLLPRVNHVSVSQKLSAELRTGLQQKLIALIDRLNSSQSGEKISYGFILRTNAAQAKEHELIEDIIYLHKVWQDIKKRATAVPVKSLVRAELNLAQRVLRDIADDKCKRILVDDFNLANRLESFAREYVPDVADKITYYDGQQQLFDKYLIDQSVQEALGNKVALKSGGYLIIEQTEALTTIDINTGAYIGKKAFAATVLQTNLEAAKEIVRQLRLRNLGGIVVVDFIDMAEKAAQQTVLAELRKFLSTDKVKTTVSEFSALGLVELTRKRSRESLSQMLCEKCPVCCGRGTVKTIRTVAYQILREIEREAKLFEPKSFRIIASAAVAELLLDEENEYLTVLTQKINKPVLLQCSSDMGREDFDIILS